MNTTINSRNNGLSHTVPMSETAFQAALGRMTQGQPFKQAFKSLKVADRDALFEFLMAPKGI